MGAHAEGKEDAILRGDATLVTVVPSVVVVPAWAGLVEEAMPVSFCQVLDAADTHQLTADLTPVAVRDPTDLAVLQPRAPPSGS